MEDAVDRFQTVYISERGVEGIGVCPELGKVAV